MEAHLAYSPLPALLVLVPIAATALIYPLGRRSEALRDWFAVAVTGLTFAGAISLIPVIAHSHRVACTVPLMIGRLTFLVDPFGMLFGLFTSFVWLLSTLYAGDYMHHEHKRDRYYTYNLALLGSNLGVVFAGDLITLYLFFEALGLLAYWVVVHAETPEAKAASIKYIWMTVIGGFLLVGGIFLAYGLGSRGLIAPIEVGEGMEVLRWIAVGLMVLGFGVKAGMLPVHVWLPDAHPVAPSPGSALLSGVMIKAGAYGIFRVVTALFRPPIAEHYTEEMWHFTSQLGYVVLWIGIVTMFVGVAMALLQENAKRMLAYHSVSQMGFILAGLGAAGYLGPHAAMGIAGGLYHVLNHALFKACLFLGVGAVFFRTGELNMYKLGGLWRKMPMTFLFTLIAAFGITGVPLFNGFVSKCLIHHALVEAGELHELPALKVAEIVYIITCGGTACSFMKLIGFVFLGKAKRSYEGVRDAPPRMLVAMGTLAVAMAVFGMAPQLVLQGVMVPGLHAWGLHSAILDEFHLMTPENLESVAIAFAIGATIFVVGVRFGLFHTHFPAWFSIDYWYERGAYGGLSLCGVTGGIYQRWTSAVSAILRAARVWLASVTTGRRRERLVWWFSLGHWYEVGAVALMALAHAVGAAYQRGLDDGSAGLRSLRSSYTAMVRHTRRRWRRIWLTLTTGAPAFSRRRVIDRAYVVFDQERQATVREAVDAALRVARVELRFDDDNRQAYLDAVRQIADYMAMRLFKERLAVIGDAVQKHPSERVEVAVEVGLPALALYREPVVASALELAIPRQQGCTIVRRLSHAMNELLRQERYDMRLHDLLAADMAAGAEIAAAKARGAMRGVSPRLAADMAAGAEIAAAKARGGMRGVSPKLERARDYGTGQLTALERWGKWFVDVLRVIVEAATEERVPWMIEERVSRESIVATRGVMLRYSRDVSLNVAVLVAVFLGLLLAVLVTLR